MRRKIQLKDKLGRTLKHLRVPKRATLIIISLLVLIVAVICLILWSMQTWSQYSDNYNQHYNNIKTEIDSVIKQATPNKTNTELITKLNRIIQAQNKIKDEINPFCDVTTFVRWQSFVQQYLDKIKDCEYKKGHLNQLIDDLGILTAYLGAEQRLAAVISSANEKTIQNNQSNKWELIEQFWRQAIIDTSKLPNTTEFKPIKTLASKGLISVADAWKQLVIANEAKNRQNFEKAKTDLNSAYTLLSSIGDSSKAWAEKLVTNFNDSYKKAF
jgi:nitrogen fixation-related uncharacterized protein